MTPAEKEAEKVHTAYQDALVALGGKVLIETLKAYESVTVGNAASLAAFSAKVAAIIYLYRRKARDISVAAAQLERALLTGVTYEDWREPFKTTPTFGDLRATFYRRIGEFGIRRPLRARTHGPELAAQVERIPAMRAAEVAADELLDAEIDTTVKVLGEREPAKKLAQIKPTTTDERAQAIREEAQRIASSTLANGAERIALNGARDHDSNIIRLDTRVIGWVRIHSEDAPDDPCGWCSMLMSRGHVYRTESAALLEGAESEFAQYHPGCHCTAVKVYSQRQYSSPKFNANREYQRLWSQVTKGLSGDAAVSAWRKYIRQRATSIPVKQAQEATAA